MASRRLVAVALAASLFAAGSARGDEARYCEQGGVPYCETRRTVQERVPESRMEERTETVYREHLATEMQETTRTYWSPVTEYRWEAFWVGRWNPLVEPYLAYRYVPRTHWEMRTETVKVPVTARRLVPEPQPGRGPGAGWRTVEKELVDRVAVGRGPTGSPLAPAQAPALAEQRAIGGISRLDNPVPPYGGGPAWRPSGGTVRR